MDWLNVGYAVLKFGSEGITNASWWQVLLFTLITTHITIAGVTIYLHRCQAHRAVDLHPIVSHFFRFWLWANTGMVTKQWSAVHRKHHAKCETEEDPHSPVTRGIKTVLLQGAELYRVESRNKETEDKYGHGAPDDWIERNLYYKHTLVGVYMTLLVDILLFGFIGISVFAIQMLWIPILAAGVINGVGHFMGYRHFDAPDQSRNIVPFGFLIGGEELHNNHHAFATSAKFSSRWYEIDVGWYYICILQFFGLAKVRKVAPKPKFTQARSHVDIEALQAVIHHRYDMMAAYARSIRTEAKLAIDKRRAAKDSEQVVTGRLAARWLPEDDERWPEIHREKLTGYLAGNEALAKMVGMRDELVAIWDRSSAGREQLVQQLQAWCHQAENSGVQALQVLSQRVRSYAI
jgi:stearoyl-CoA desaturase (Delta-9 desaturase)